MPIEGASPTLLRNVAETKNNWLKIKLIGDVAKKTPKDAIGSTVFITTGKLRQRYDLTSGANYASQNEQTIHAGLGEAAKIDKLEIFWANGQTETIAVGKLNTLMIIKQNGQIIFYAKFRIVIIFKKVIFPRLNDSGQSRDFRASELSRYSSEFRFV